MSSRGTPTTSIRWHPDDRERFEESIEKLQLEGEAPLNMDRSEMIRAVLNWYAENPDPSAFE